MVEQPAPLPGDTPQKPPADSAWLATFRQHSTAIWEEYGRPPLSLDMEFVAFLRAFARFGYFTFGPVSTDVRVVEQIFDRTAVRGDSPDEFGPVTDDYVRFTVRMWEEVRRRGDKSVDELHCLLAFMRSAEGLPARVFGELGVRPEQVEEYASSLAGGRPAGHGAAEKLYSTEEAAEYFGVHVQTVRTWIRSGRLPAFKLAGQKAIRIRERDLAAVMEPIEPAG